MNEKYSVSFFLILMVVIKLSAQNYNVATYQKINDSNGGFLSNLDNSDYFGVSSDYIGDLNGDGFEDIAVGAYRDDDGGFNRGAVYILFLGENNTVINETKISDTQGGFTGVLDDDDRFGGAVSFLGDINNDGSIEIAVGADYDGDGGFWHGAVWILSLNSDGTVLSHSKISDTQGGFDGFVNGDAIFGTDIENIGDLDGDGIDDLAVGSRRDGDGGSRRGAVWILFMNSDLTVSSEQKISDTQGGFDGLLEYEDYFGGSVANIGDLNNDGVNDIAVGAYRDDDGQQNSGSFYVLFLNTDGTVNSYQKVSNTTGGFSENITSQALFGESIDGVIDIDNDGKIEVIVGAMKQNNPSLSFSTGAFYIVELNVDGTVSENHLYTYDEFCFLGLLNAGDLFGGSVTLSKTGTNLNSIAVGAYGDSENGYRRGAMWILELRNSESYQFLIENPTTCGGLDGSIIYSGFIPNTEYSIDYDYNNQSENLILTANDIGEISIVNLGAGVYSDIMISQNDNLICELLMENVELVSDEFVLTIILNSNSECNASTGSILISNLNPNTIYDYYYEFEGATYSGQFTSDGVGEWIIVDLAAGDYENIMIVDNVSSCTDGIGLLTIENEVLNIEVNVINPTLCGLNDGSILFSNAMAGLNYNISYLYEDDVFSLNEVANSEGEIIVSMLNVGIYENIIITENESNCTQVIDDLNLIAAEADFIFTSSQASRCGMDDASILISNLTPDLHYEVSYDFNQETVSDVIVSNSLGEILIDGLESGTYENIIVIDNASSCSDIEPTLIIQYVDFIATIIGQSQLNCNDVDGEIIILGLSQNENYIVNYSYNNVYEVINTTSNSLGEIIISNLENGSYTEISILETLTNCVASLENVVIENLVTDYQFSVVPLTSCLLPNGEIVISNLDLNSSYQIKYEHENQIVELNLESDINGYIIISNLQSGDYLNVFAENILTGCSDYKDIIVVDSVDLQGVVYLDCRNSKGVIGFDGLSPGFEYELSYLYDSDTYQVNGVADNDGVVEFDGFADGLYFEITISDVISGCEKLLGVREINCFQNKNTQTKCFEVKPFFTPNGDTVNDYWQLINVKDNCSYTVFVYNRYGKILKSLTNFDNKWDGTLNGYHLPSDDYWFTVEYNYNQESFSIYKSHFALKR